MVWVFLAVLVVLFAAVSGAYDSSKLSAKTKVVLRWVCTMILIAVSSVIWIFEKHMIEDLLAWTTKYVLSSGALFDFARSYLDDIKRLFGAGYIFGAIEGLIVGLMVNDLYGMWKSGKNKPGRAGQLTRANEPSELE